jgi:hypothetical protein
MKQISEFMAKLDAMDSVMLLALVIGYMFICISAIKGLFNIDDKDDYNKGEGKL